MASGNTTLVMAFSKGEQLPWAGETRIMRGGYGTSYAVTIHRIIKVEADGDVVRITARATKRAITDSIADTSATGEGQ